LALDRFVFDAINAVLAVPLVDFADLLLRHLEEVFSALRVKPATIGTSTFIFAHNEVASEGVELSATLAEVFNVLALMRLIDNFIIFLSSFAFCAFHGLFRDRAKEDLLGVLQLPCNVLLVLVFPA